MRWPVANLADILGSNGLGIATTVARSTIVHAIERSNLDGSAGHPGGAKIACCQHSAKKKKREKGRQKWLVIITLCGTYPLQVQV